MLEQINLFFNEESHTYTDGKTNYVSVTTLIGGFDEAFDADYWAMYRALEQNESYKAVPFPTKKQVRINYGGANVTLNLNIFKGGYIPVYKSLEEIKNEWIKNGEMASTEGSKEHSYIEDIINECSTENVNYENAKFNSILKGSYKKVDLRKLVSSKLRTSHELVLKTLVFYLQKGYNLLTEVRIYDSEYKVAGTIDALFVKGKDVVVMDWKTNKEDIKFVAGSYKKEWNAFRTKKIRTDVFNKRSTKMKAPLNDLYSCKGNLYTMQLSTYAYILERWGFNVQGLILVHIKPETNSEDDIIYDEFNNRVIKEIKVLKLQYLKDHVLKMLNFHASRV